MQKLPDHILTSVARELDIDETDVIMMAPYRKHIREAIKSKLEEEGLL